MSDTTGWTRDGVDSDHYSKSINDKKYTIQKRTTGFFPGQWMVLCEGQPIHGRHSGKVKLTDAKRVAHEHARQSNHG